jgi:hypothetical protein
MWTDWWSEKIGLNKILLSLSLFLKYFIVRRVETYFRIVLSVIMYMTYTHSLLEAHTTLSGSVPCHHVRARPQVAAGDVLQVGR